MANNLKLARALPLQPPVDETKLHYCSSTGHLLPLHLTKREHRSQSRWLTSAHSPLNIVNFGVNSEARLKATLEVVSRVPAHW